ncbi:MAG: flagellar FliJ family protein, partial [SAR324 cluster bacterium]|nr:flagellar FliJ family protein [SAR324 cluster bacterium]
QIQQELRDHKKLMEGALETHDLNLNQSKKSGFTVMQLQMSDHFKERLGLQMEVNQNQLKEQEQVIELKRQELTRATQKKRVLEILKEKQQQRFEEEMDRQERQEADEIAQGLRRYSVQ